MGPPAGWQNPITVQPGQMQKGVEARLLLPSRPDLIRRRLEHQRLLLLGGYQRFTPIQVTAQGVIHDGHHGARAAAERGITVDVLVVAESVPPVGLWILDLPVR
jgi:hypothetical protein